MAETKASNETETATDNTEITTIDNHRGITKNGNILTYSKNIDGWANYGFDFPTKPNKTVILKVIPLKPTKSSQSIYVMPGFATKGVISTQKHGAIGYFVNGLFGIPKVHYIPIFQTKELLRELQLDKL